MSLKKFILPLVLALALVLGACSPGAPTGDIPDTGETAAAEVTLPPAATETEAATEPAATETEAATEPAATETQAATEPAATETQAATAPVGGFETTAAFVEALEAAGAEVEQAGAVDEPIFQVSAENLTVDGEQVQVFEFADEAARQAAADTIEANGFIIGTTAVDWIGTPNFWSAGNLIVLYVGENETQISRISGLMGDPITGPGQAGGGLPPEAALEAQRFLADELGITAEDIPIVNVEQVDWQDSCLGLGGPAESCAQVITPGWRVTLRVDTQEFEVRTNQDATVIRTAQTGGAAATATP